ncbi:MAG: sulfite exporter TauE/SafE family protein, partial [Myxococcota bacterium]|nr:sulfite exporter TauE/SafE family protein [Myxococcota bacterium]
HCIAMCGPLVGLHGGARTLRLALVHALGRLTTYVTLGTLAGAIGHAIDLAGDLGTVQRAATLAAGGIVIGWGVYQLAVVAGWKARTPAVANTAFGEGLHRIGTKRAATRAWMIGVLTGLLPCGWLWAFVVTAAGTGHPLAGAGVMAVFWLGTVPAMTGVLTFGGPIVSWLRSRMPAVTAIVLILLGLGTLATRWGDAGVPQVSQPSCHEVAR